MSDETMGILASGERLAGDEFRDKSFRAAQAVGQLLRETYGPYGRDKLLVDHLGTGYVSNQGSDILDRLHIDNPVAQLLVDTCEASERYADGSTFAVLLACELLEEADALLEQGLPPAEIVRGFDHARAAAERALADVAVPLELDDRERYALVSTATAGRFTEANVEHLRRVVLDAADVLGSDVSLDRVHFEESIRLSLDSSRVVAGAVLRADPPHDDMPTDVVDARVLLLSDPVTRQKPSEMVGHENVTIHGEETVEGAVASTRRTFDERVQAITDTGADVVVCRGNLDDRVVTELASAGMLVFHENDVPQEDFERVHRAVGGSTAPPEDVESATLGYSGRVTVTNVGSGTKSGVLFADCDDSDTVSIVVHAGTASGSDQAKRVLKQGLGALAAAHEEPRAVPGGGAAEMEAARAVRDAASEVRSRGAVAVDAYADALESTVAQLVSNCGHSPLDGLPRLRSAHADGEVDAAVDVETGGLTSAYEQGIIEPYESKRLALGAGTDSAVSLLRVDAILPRVDDESSPGPDQATQDRISGPGWGRW